MLRSQSHQPHKFYSTLLLFLVTAMAGVLWPAFAAAATLAVTTTNDSGAGSLRQAITDANVSADVADTINFAISSGEQTITVLSALPEITDTLTIDGTTQPGFAGTPFIVLKAGAEVKNASGLHLATDNSTIKGLVINGFVKGIEIWGNGNRVRGCYIGLNTAGTAPVGSDTGIETCGIEIVDGVGNVIGGLETAARNVIVSGIHMIFGDGSIMQGNYIGTNASGTAAIGWGGITSALSGSHTIGGTQPGARNVIVGGINLNTGSNSNTIQGNYIGCNAAGTAAFGNGASIYLSGGGSNNVIGGTGTAARNVVSSIYVDGLAYSTTIKGNSIGTNAAGTAAMGTGGGIYVRDGQGTIIGGAEAGAGNVIANSSGHGIELLNCSSTVIKGNYIGTNAAGTAAIRNGLDGVYMLESQHTQVGGTELGAGNLISGNKRHGVFIDTTRVYHETGLERRNVVQGNYIGTNAGGTAALGNGGSGVQLQSTSFHIIGGPTAGARNVISGNRGDGVSLLNSWVTTVQHNYIGTNAAGSAAIGNGANGIKMDGAPESNYHADKDIIDRNVIAANSHNGIEISESSTNPVSVTGNSIGTNVAGTGALGNSGDGVKIRTSTTYSESHKDIGGTAAGEGNRIAFNGGNGVNVVPGSSSPYASHIRGNSIFANAKLGIDIGNNGVTPNDGDKTVSNAVQDFPVITGVLQADGVTTLTGTLSSGPDTTYLLDFYRSATPDSSGYGEGETYIGATSVTTNADGNATFSFSFPGNYAGQTFAATATVGPFGATSEFGPTRFSISGRITTSDGTGVAGASVTRSGNSTAEGNGTTVQTDADGNYSFTGVASGTYTVNATGSGYTFAASNFTNPISVQNTRSDINFTATATPAGSYSISGRVANNSGVGMVNISVTLNGSRQVTTDNNGNYTFTGVLSGTYLVKPVLTPSLSGVTFTPAQLTVVVNGGNLFNQNFSAGFVLSGRVTNHSGTGVPNVLVQRKAGASIVGMYTDGNGNYSFSNVRSGSYTIAPVLTSGMSGMSFTPVERTVTVDRSNIFNQSFIGMFSVGGRVTTHAGAGLSNVLVRLRDKVSGAYVTSQSTDGNGNYQIRNVRSGNYTVAPELTPSMSGMGFTPLMREVEVSKTNITNQNFIAMFSISGRVTTSAGAGLANVLVRLNTSTTSTSTRTDSNGNYSFSNVRSGEYTLVPEGSGFNPASRAVTMEKQNLTNQNFVGS